jgi:hypothetical protein
MQEKRTEILDRMNIILGYLSDLSIIPNGSNSKPYLPSFRGDFRDIQIDFKRQEGIMCFEMKLKDPVLVQI